MIVKWLVSAGDLLHIIGNWCSLCDDSIIITTSGHSLPLMALHIMLPLLCWWIERLVERPCWCEVMVGLWSHHKNSCNLATLSLADSAINKEYELLDYFDNEKRCWATSYYGVLPPDFFFSLDNVIVNFLSPLMSRKVNPPVVSLDVGIIFTEFLMFASVRLTSDQDYQY